MILQNYAKACACKAGIKTNGVSSSSMSYANLGFLISAGETSGTLEYSANEYGKSWIDVGFGETSETYGDYNLEQPNNGTLLTHVSTVAIPRGAKDILNLLAVFRNDGQSNVVVKEIGWFHNFARGNTCLITRKVLDSPVTIAPNESYSFNYIIKIKD